jgi:hypothetical protein
VTPGIYATEEWRWSRFAQTDALPPRGKEFANERFSKFEAGDTAPRAVPADSSDA